MTNNNLHCTKPVIASTYPHDNFLKKNYILQQLFYTQIYQFTEPAYNNYIISTVYWNIPLKAPINEQ